MEIRDSRRLGGQRYCLVAQLRRVRLLENKEGGPAAGGARQVIGHAQNERVRRSESGSVAYAPAGVEKLEAGSDFALDTSKTVSNLVVCQAALDFIAAW